ncbi:MAG: ATP-binding protein [Candidatus Desantisbacteria bacterium]
MNNFNLNDITSIYESVDFECKASQGRDGNGEVSGSFWETYSAMANTNGGEVYLGIKETSIGKFCVDCRNRRIQDMFRYVGFGDHAGSGIPKIYRNWKEQHWRLPLLYEDATHEQTLLELRMISLFPEKSMKMLDELFGEQFRKLPELERVILITAATEDIVHHARIKGISSEHPKDISVALAHLVQEEMLIKEGETRASIYHLPGKGQTDASSLLQTTIETNSQDLSENSPDKDENSPDKDENSPDKDENSPDKDENSPDKDENSPDLKIKLINVLNSLGLDKMPDRIKPDMMRKIILRMCENNTLSLKEFCSVLNRGAKTLQDQYLTPMLGEGLLELKYPDIKNHPDQAYKKKTTITN